MKNKIYNIILIILGIVLLVVLTLIAIKYGGNQINENNLHSVVDEVKTQIEQIEQVENNEEQKQVQVEYKGYNVVGIISIPAIGIEYPILDTTNEKTMKVAITKFWGNNVNDLGNFTMAGHNNKDGTMFGKTKRLNIGDKIEMTDLTGKTIEYEIFDQYLIDPNDVSCVKSVKENTREVTLITCANGRSNRLITKAREIIKNK